MRFIRALLTSFLFVALTAAVSFADVGLLSGARFSMAAQGGFGWTTDSDSQRGQEDDQEPCLALVPAWNLGEFGSAVSGLRLGLASQVLSFEPKFSVILPLESAQVSGWAGYRFLSDLDDDHPLEKSSEPFVGASLVVPIGGRWAASVPVNHGLESHQTTVDLRLSFLLVEGGEGR